MSYMLLKVGMTRTMHDQEPGIIRRSTRRAVEYVTWNGGRGKVSEPRWNFDRIVCGIGRRVHEEGWSKFFTEIRQRLVTVEKCSDQNEKGLCSHFHSDR